MKLSLTTTHYHAGAGTIWRDTSSEVHVALLTPATPHPAVGRLSYWLAVAGAMGITPALNPAADAVADEWLKESDWFTCRDRDDVSHFLAAHPEVRRVLPLIRTMIFRHFGSDAIVEMEVIRDPSAPDQQGPALLAAICTSLDPMSAERRLTELDQEWLQFDLPSPPDFTIDVEYC